MHPLLRLAKSHERRSVYLMLESQFQSKLIKKLKKLFPGCIVVKNDPGYLQGFPDLTVYYGDKWATLECKQSAGAKKQPNQEYYVGKMNEMSFSRFICPENEEEVLNDLQQTFQS
nr:MAG TPA: Nuclease [Caudoviricetes sp.]